MIFQDYKDAIKSLIMVALNQRGFKNFETDVRIDKKIEINIVADDSLGNKNWIVWWGSHSSSEKALQKFISKTEKVDMKTQLPHKIIFIFFFPYWKKDFKPKQEIIEKFRNSGFSLWGLHSNKVLEYVDEKYSPDTEFSKTTGQLIEPELSSKIKKVLDKGDIITEKLLRTAILSGFEKGAWKEEERAEKSKLKDAFFNDLLIGGLVAGGIFLILDTIIEESEPIKAIMLGIGCILITGVFWVLRILYRRKKGLNHM